MTETDGFGIDKIAAMVAGLGSWKSAWLARQPKFYRVDSPGYESGITCDVQQEVQDWLMREFDPATMWEYTSAQYLGVIQTGFDRVTMREEVYSMLLLRWS